MKMLADENIYEPIIVVRIYSGHDFKCYERKGDCNTIGGSIVVSVSPVINIILKGQHSEK